jgi:hypothetical protein
LPIRAARIPARRPNRREPSMKRHTVTLGFTLVAIWIAVVFVLVSRVTP